MIALILLTSVHDIAFQIMEIHKAG